MKLRTTLAVLAVTLVAGLVVPSVANAELDIEEIFIDTAEDYLNGAAPPYNRYWMEELAVVGTGITSVTVTPPGKDSVALDLDEGRWELEGNILQYATLALLRADYPVGNYVFSFNGGDDSVTVWYDPTAPSGIVDLSSIHGRTDVPWQTPTFSWPAYAGTGGDALGMWLFDPGAGEDLYENAPPIDIGETSWTLPGDLAPSAAYGLEVSVYAVQGGSPATLETVGYDEFTYYPVFENINIAEFSTPEPVTLALMGLGALGLVARRRSQIRRGGRK